MSSYFGSRKRAIHSREGLNSATSNEMLTTGGIIVPPAGSGHRVDGLLRGSLWMIASRWAIRMLGLASTLVLVRLLAPEDFGVVAMVMLAYGLLETISYAGVDLALLRQTTTSREHYDTAWTLQILQGCFIATLLLLSGPWV